MALNVGDRLEHYDVIALIGEGGMGQVYQARTPSSSVRWRSRSSPKRSLLTGSDWLGFNVRPKS